MIASNQAPSINAAVNINAYLYKSAIEQRAASSENLLSDSDCGSCETGIYEYAKERLSNSVENVYYEPAVQKNVFHYEKMWESRFSLLHKK
jgi:hypothetical protein